MRQKAKQNGFTLIELVTTVVIAGIVGTFAVNIIMSLLTSWQLGIFSSQVQNQGQQIQSVLPLVLSGVDKNSVVVRGDNVHANITGAGQDYPIILNAQTSKQFSMTRITSPMISGIKTAQIECQDGVAMRFNGEKVHFSSAASCDVSVGRSSYPDGPQAITVAVTFTYDDLQAYYIGRDYVY